MEKWYIQALIVLPALIGSLLLSYPIDEIEVYGWSLYLFSDLIGVYFFIKKKLWLMTVQYIIFGIIAFNAVYQRIGDYV